MIQGKSKGTCLLLYFWNVSWSDYCSKLIKMVHTYRILRKIIMMVGKSKGDMFTLIFVECLLV